MICKNQDQVRKAKKKIGGENIQKAIKAATEIAEAAASEGKPFCIARVDVGADTTAVREAVLKIMDQKVSNSISVHVLISLHMCCTGDGVFSCLRYFYLPYYHPLTLIVNTKEGNTIDDCAGVCYFVT